MKFYVIDSKNGPEECELAVFHFFNWLVLNDFIDSNPDRVIHIERGAKDYDDYKSISFKSNKDLTSYIGNIQVNFKSPYRKNCKRKSWFIELTCLGSASEISDFKENDIEFVFSEDPSDSSVRGTYQPNGFTASSSEENNRRRNQRNVIEQIKIQLLKEKNSKTAVEEDAEPKAIFTKDNHFIKII